MSMTINHPYHLVNYSPWPLNSSISIFMLMTGTMKMFFYLNNMNNLIIISMMMLLMSSFQWWRDIVRESSFQGFHSSYVIKGLKLGMIFFIASEVMFFFSFFWNFFHSSLSPNVELGMGWPPMGIVPFNPLQIPMLNTMILLSSGLSITWSHNSMIENKLYQMNYSLTITILLGLYFSIIQLYEYTEASFTMMDSSYGSTFYLTTGFHGLHVIIGTVFLIVTFIRQMSYQFSKYHHLGFETAAWYWHFVDIVWLFLFTSMYWWKI